MINKLLYGMSLSSLLMFSHANVYANTAIVSSSADNGAGSFRAAIELANSDSSYTEIDFNPGLGPINLVSSVIFIGPQPLMISGENTTIDGSGIGAGNTFETTMTKYLSIKDLAVEDSTAKGILVSVPLDADSDVMVTLDNVTITGSSLYGLHIDDNSNDEDDEGEGAPIGVIMTLMDSSFTGNGTGELDFDGVRVDERGNGGISAYVFNTAIDANGGDGMELDEGQNGNVELYMSDSSLNENGFFNEEDLDDGLDIDEGGQGNILVTMMSVDVNGNYDEGLDFDEAGQGNVKLNLTDITAEENMDEGIKVDEEDDGSINAQLTNVSVSDGGDDGIQMESVDKGQLHALMTNVTSTGNAKYGVKLETDDKGWLKHTNSDFSGNDDGDLELVNVKEK